MIPDKIYDPVWLLLFFLVFLWFFRPKTGKNSLNISAKSLVAFSSGRLAFDRIVDSLQFFFLFAVFCLLVLIAARPVRLIHGTYIEREVRQIGLVVDVSTSMSGTAGDPEGKSGVERIKEILIQFVEKRRGDWFSLSVYSGYPGRKSGGSGVLRFPTSSIIDIQNSIERIQPRMYGSHTALGEGLFASIVSMIKERLDYLKEEQNIDLYSSDLRKAIEDPRDRSNMEYLDFFCEMVGHQENKVIVLFTDGIYNTGISPRAPMLLAKSLGIRVYVVALKPRGATGVYDPKEKARRRAEIIAGAVVSGGRYFDGEDYDDIAGIYDELDKIEKAKIFIKKTNEFEERFGFYAFIAFLCFAGRALLQYFWIKCP